MMTDLLNIKLKNGILANICSKLLMMYIRKKTGYKVDIQINDLDINVVDNVANVKTNVELKFDIKQLA